MSYMFSNCSLVKYLPDISKWDVSNVENMSYMFWNCISLNSLPSISCWNVSNVKYLNYIFSDCISLSVLPDIKYWDIKNIIEMNYIFDNIRNEMEIIYAFNKNDTKINIFGKAFVENNKDKCLLLIKNKIYELTEIYEL